jgi:hypothetical protein
MKATMIYMIRRFCQDCADFVRIAVTLGQLRKRQRSPLLALYIAQFNGPRRYYQPLP